MILSVLTQNGAKVHLEINILTDIVCEMHRLIEESDLQNAKDLFGEDLDEKIDEIVPKTEEEFEAFAKILAGKYVTPHKVSGAFSLKPAVALCFHSLSEDIMSLN